MKAYEVRKNGKLIDIIVSDLDLEKVKIIAAEKHLNETLEVFESPYTKGKDIQYCKELDGMCMVQLSDKTYYPLFSYISGKEVVGTLKSNSKNYATCNTIKDINDIRR